MFKTTTGFGYLVKDGRKYKKFIFNPNSEHPSLPEGVIAIEVENEDVLDKIVLDKSDEEIQREQKRLEKQAHKERALSKLKILGFSDEEIEALLT